MKTPSPIKRDKSLVSLSKDHHDGLLLVWKIRQGVRLNIEPSRIAFYIIHVFNQELEPHFFEEETLLFTSITSNDELRIKAEDQHAAIHEKVAALRSLPEPEAKDLLSFASLLDEHIRFEERVLFPYAEKVIPREVLDAIGVQLDQHHNNKECAIWPDEFWIKK